jgi:hypothetical protein
MSIYTVEDEEGSLPIVYGGQRLRCNAKLGFRVFMRLENNQPHAALSPHGVGELFDVFRSVEFSHSMKTLNATHTYLLLCAHLC